MAVRETWTDMQARVNKKRNILYTFALGTITLIAAFAIYALGIQIDDRILTFIIAFGLVMVLMSIYQYVLFLRHPDKAEGDERTQKLGGMAMFYTWLSSLLFVFILLALDYLGAYKMTAFFALGLTLAFMFLTGIGLSFLFWSRGDV